METETLTSAPKPRVIDNLQAMMFVILLLSEHNPMTKMQLIRALKAKETGKSVNRCWSSYPLFSPYNIIFRSFNQKGKVYNESKKHQYLMKRSLVALGLIEPKGKNGGQILWGLSEKGQFAAALLDEGFGNKHFQMLFQLTLKEPKPKPVNSPSESYISNLKSQMEESVFFF